MVSSAEFSSLVGEIYDAVADPERWSLFLRHLRAMLLGGVAALFVQDMRSNEVDLVLSEGQDAAATAAYEQHYAKVNLWLHASQHLPAGVIVRTHELIDRRAFEKSEFYNDWLAPQDLYFGLGAAVVRSADVQTSFTALRSKGMGPFTGAETELFQHLASHVERAIAIHRRLSSITRRQRVTQGALEDLPLGFLLLDRGRRIVFANRRAAAMLEEADGILSIGGRLRVAGVQAMARLSALVVGASAPGPAGAEPSGGGMSLTGRSGRFLSLLVCPYMSFEANLDLMRPSAIVFVCEQQRADRVIPAFLVQLYRLTPAEARLAAALTNGETLAAYAERAGITLETARSYLKAVFTKTGTQRQSQLVGALSSDPVLRLAGRRLKGAD